MSLKDAILSLSRKYSKDRTLEDQALVERDLAKILDNFIQVFSDDARVSWIEINTILYFDNEDKMVQIVTKDHKFKATIPEECLHDLAEKNNFYEVDRYTYVDLDKVIEYDSLEGVLYFDEGNKELKLKVSLRRLAKMVKILGTERDICYLKKDKKCFSYAFRH